MASNVLRWLKTQPDLASLRVVVLTSSEDIRDVTKAYHLGSQLVPRKTARLPQHTAMVKTITRLWLGITMNPGSSG